MRRRSLMLGASAVAIAAYMPRSLGAQPSVHFLPYSPTWQTTHPLAKCQDYRQMIDEAKQLRLAVLNDNKLVDALIEAYVAHGKALEAEAAALRKQLQATESKLTVERVAITVSLVFLAVGLFATKAPIAVGVIGALAIPVGTALIGFQVIYGGDGAPKIVAGYLKDRVLMIGEAVADSLKSTGGKLATHALGCGAVLWEIHGHSETREDQERLRQAIERVATEAEGIAALIKKQPLKARPVWKAMFDNLLEGTIASLERLVAQEEANDCRLDIRVQTGPVIRAP